MSDTYYPKQKYIKQDDLQRDYHRIVTLILQGKLDNTGSVTLTANSATTTVTEGPNRIGLNTVILFMPTTANAATEFGAGSLYVSSRDTSVNTFTITHANNAQTDRTFNYVLIGT